MRAKDIMTTPVHTIRRDASVQEAAKLLAATSVTALPVLDNFGALVGMVSEGDLLRQRVPRDLTAHARRQPDIAPDRRPTAVHEAMSHRPITATANADVADIADLMLQHDVRSVPIVDGRAVIGIVSRRDILRSTIRGDDVVTAEIQHRLDEYAGDTPRWVATVHDGTATVTGRFSTETERTVVHVLVHTVPGVVAVHLHGD